MTLELPKKETYINSPTPGTSIASDFISTHRREIKSSKRRGRGKEEGGEKESDIQEKKFSGGFKGISGDLDAATKSGQWK